MTGFIVRRLAQLLPVLLIASLGIWAMIYAVPGSPWGEYFLGTPPGVPLDEVKLFPGMAAPADGRLIPSDAPGFGLGVSLDDIAALRV